MSNPDQPVPPLPQYGEYAPQQPVPPQYYAPAPQPVLRAPEGTKPYTVWIWLITAIPLVGLIVSIPYFFVMDGWLTEFYQTVFSAMPTDGGRMSSAESQQLMSQMFASMGPLYLQMGLYWLAGQAFNVLIVVFAWLDHRALTRRGVPKPFHWGWSFFAFAGASNLVTVIGRTVVVRRRTGSGLAPIWAMIAIYAVSLIVSFVAIVMIMLHVSSTLAQYTGTGA